MHVVIVNDISLTYVSANSRDNAVARRSTGGYNLFAETASDWNPLTECKPCHASGTYGRISTVEVKIAVNTINEFAILKVPGHATSCYDVDFSAHAGHPKMRSSMPLFAVC